MQAPRCTIVDPSVIAPHHDYGRGWHGGKWIRKKKRYALFTQTGWRCAYCGEADPLKFCIDHIIPESAGGDNSASNLITACGSCNSGFGNLPKPDWARRRIAYYKARMLPLRIGQVCAAWMHPTRAAHPTLDQLHVDAQLAMGFDCPDERCEQWARARKRVYDALLLSFKRRLMRVIEREHGGRPPRGDHMRRMQRRVAAAACVRWCKKVPGWSTFVDTK